MISFNPRYLFLEGLPSVDFLGQLLETHRTVLRKIFILTPSAPVSSLEHSVRTRFEQEFTDGTIEIWSGLAPFDFWQKAQSFFGQRKEARFLSTAVWMSDPHAQCSSSDSESFEAYRAQWESVQSVVRESFGSEEGTLLGLQNTMQNLSTLLASPGIHSLRDLFKGMKAVVVSTGPSLMHSLKELKTLQDKVILFAPDASLKILLENEITPHFVLSMERVSGSEPFFEKAAYENAARTLNLVAFSIVPPSVLSAFQGNKWLCYREEEVFAILEQYIPRGFLLAGHSVAHQALSLADWVGCTEVHLVGQDLAFDPETLQSHPDGIAYQRWSDRKTVEQLEADLHARGEWLQWTAGNLVEKLPTSNLYELFNREFTLMLPRLRAKVFNSTQGGAKIEGFPWKPLSTLTTSGLISFAKNPFEAIEEVYQQELQRVRMASFSPAPILNYMGTKLKELEKMRDETKALLDAFLRGPAGKENLVSAKIILSSLAAEKESLINDPVFVALFAHYLGSNWIDLENQWAALPTKIEDQFPERLRLLQVWTEALVAVGKRVRATLAEGVATESPSTSQVLI